MYFHSDEDLVTVNLSATDSEVNISQPPELPTDFQSSITTAAPRQAKKRKSSEDQDLSEILGALGSSSMQITINTHYKPTLEYVFFPVRPDTHGNDALVFLRGLAESMMALSPSSQIQFKAEVWQLMARLTDEDSADMLTVSNLG